MKTLLRFYLKNFKVIHHSVFILMVFGTLKLCTFLPLIGWCYSLIFQPNLIGLFFQIGLLITCFKINPHMLEKAGLTDEYMKEQLDNLDKNQKTK